MQNTAYAIIEPMIANKRAGYTILEVLIFLSVSSLMFVTAMRTINGRQKQVQFTQSIQEFDAKIRDIINDVTTGYYPTNETVNCNVIGDDVEIIESTGEKLGTNDECIYVGKVIHFKSNGDDTAMKIYAMAGKRYSSSDSTPSDSISDAKPKAVSLPGNSNFTETAENFITLYGLKVTRVFRPISDIVFTDYGSLAFMSYFGGSGVSEAQAVQIGGISGSIMGSNELSSLSIINQITDNPGNGPSPPTGYFESNTAEGIVICLEGSGGKKASLTVDAGGDNSTILQVDNRNGGCV